MFTPIVEVNFKAIYGRSANRALEILQARLGMVSHKILKEEIMLDAKPIRQELRVKVPDASKYTLPDLKVELTKFVTDRVKFYKAEMPIHEEVYFSALKIYERSIRSTEEKAAYVLYTDYVQKMRKGYDSRTMGDMSQYCNKFEKEKIMPLLTPEHKKQFSNSKSVYKYLQLKIMGEFLGGVLGRRRAELHSDMIKYSGIDKIVNEAEKKTICFSNYVDTILEAKSYFEERGFQPLLVYGDTNSRVMSILEEFKNSDTANPLLATIQSLSTGVTLICANVCIFLNLPFRAADYEQASNRIFRIGQTAQVYFYDMILDTGDVPNLSTRMSDIMTWSQDQVSAILGITTGVTITESGDLTVSTEELLDSILSNETVILNAIASDPIIPPKSLNVLDW
jgi:hypothetical protein